MPALIIAVIFLSIIITNLLIGFQERRQTKYYYSLYNAEHTKSFFAKARNELMCLVVDGKIDTQTDFFKSIYNLHTFIMRHPDAYSDFSREFTKALLNIKNTNNRLLTESEKKISYSTAEALGHIVINYSSFMRFLFAFTKRIEKKMNHAGFISFLIHIGKAESKVKAEKEIRTAQAELYKISNHSPIIHC